MRIELDLYGFIKTVDINEVTYNRGYVEAKVEPGLYHILECKGDEPVKRPFEMTLRFRRVGDKRFVYEPAL
jgi:hypothetical protein